METGRRDRRLSQGEVYRFSKKGMAHLGQLVRNGEILKRYGNLTDKDLSTGEKCHGRMPSIWKSGRDLPTYGDLPDGDLSPMAEFNRWVSIGRENRGACLDCANLIRGDGIALSFARSSCYTSSVSQTIARVLRFAAKDWH